MSFNINKNVISLSQLSKYTFFLVFVFSGFSGLIYESIWSHYLKLFLGHAAYAQTLVLIIFMGGMAIGSALCAKYSSKWKNLLLGYAIVEGVIGLFGLAFHQTFVSVTNYVLDVMIPASNESPLLIDIMKWTIAALLMLPQSILLGMTFPLMVSGILRKFTGSPGKTISLLYFSNSIGAVGGVLTSSFFLIGLVGLPGTILSAGIINIILALFVWAMVREDILPAAEISTESNKQLSAQGLTVTAGILLLVSLLTGMSSFMYEIGWIRMLSMMLGSSTHSFELMLAAFILGLALGGYWIRNRIDNVANPQRLLGIIQVVMGIAAVFSVWAYQNSFEFMSLFMDVIQRKDSTYPLFLFASAAIAMLVMLPTTICAGMTLPVITNVLTRSSYGEKGVGYVYSANTIGAIIGIVLSVNILMPTIGLSNLIYMGAAIDFALGTWLIFGVVSATSSNPKLVLPRAALVLVIIIAAIGTVISQTDDRHKLLAGVFRNGSLKTDVELVYYKDGKTSTIAIYDYPNGKRILENNGKPDAGINMRDSAASLDEATQSLAGLIPLLYNPDAKNAAVIGMGSGDTAQSLLMDKTIESLDVVEIESSVVEAAEYFRPHVDYVFDDKRSSIYIDDAKSFFSSRKSKYDIIVSEPSNPWVSGVSTLFSTEFYERIKKHLTPNGTLTQWMQFYEIDIHLFATIMRSMGKHFDDYAIYQLSVGDVAIVASKSGMLTAPDTNIILDEEVKNELKRFGIHKVDNLQLRFLGNKAMLHHSFLRIAANDNSDYFPILDINAPRKRYAARFADDIIEPRTYPIPYYRRFFNGGSVYEHGKIGTMTDHEDNALSAKLISKVLRSRPISKTSTIDKQWSYETWSNAEGLRKALKTCDIASTELIGEMLYKNMKALLPYSSEDEIVTTTRGLESSLCVRDNKQRNYFKSWFRLYRLAASDNYKGASDLAEAIFQHGYTMSKSQMEFLAGISMLDIAINQHKIPRKAWLLWSQRGQLNVNPPFGLLVLLSIVGL